MTCKTLLLILLCPGLSLLVFALPARGTNPADEVWGDFEGFWWGFMDIAFYGGECYIGLEIRLDRGGRPLVRYHRITFESERWKASGTELKGDDLRIKGPDGKEFHLTLDRDRHTMTGIYKGVDLDIPVFLQFSPEIAAAAEDPAFFQNRKYSYAIPARLDDGLDCASLSEAGLAPEPVHSLMDALMADKFQNIRSLLVIKNGSLALEEYFWQRMEGGFPYRLDRDQGQNIYSATRSFTAALLSAVTTLGLFFFTLLLCLKPKGNALRRIYFGALSLIALVLSAALWSCGLFPLLLSG